jgi:hypothetical protein
MGSKLRHWVTAATLALAGVLGAPHLNFQSSASVLLLLGAFWALALSRAPQRP